MSTGKIIGLLGFIGAGKGTVADRLVSKYNFKQYSFAGSLKDACAVIFDWPRNLLEGDTLESREFREIVDEWWADKLNIPKFTPRYALQYLGTNVLRSHFNENIWFLTIQNKLRKNPTQNVVISDVRFPNEIKFLQENNGILVQIHRGQPPFWYNDAIAHNSGNLPTFNSDSKIHPSEYEWVGCNVDYNLYNNTTIDDLYTQIDKISII